MQLWLTIFGLLSPMGRALTSLPAGISTYEVSRGGGSRGAVDEIRNLVVAAVKQNENATLLEVEFPPFIGQKTSFADVDTGSVLNANCDWAMQTGAVLAADYGAALWIAFPDRKELELAREAWPGQAFQKATLTTIADAAAVLSGEDKVFKPFGSQFLPSSKPDTAKAPKPELILFAQPGDGGPVEDWLNLELCYVSDVRLLVCNGAFDKLRGGYYSGLLFPKLNACVDRFISKFDTIFYLKPLADKGRSGWLFRVGSENWQVIKQQDTDESLVLESATRPAYTTAIEALLSSSSSR